MRLEAIIPTACHWSDCSVQHTHLEEPVGLRPQAVSTVAERQYWKKGIAALLAIAVFQSDRLPIKALRPGSPNEPRPDPQHLSSLNCKNIRGGLSSRTDATLSRKSVLPTCIPSVVALKAKVRSINFGSIYIPPFAISILGIYRSPVFISHLPSSWSTNDNVPFIFRRLGCPSSLSFLSLHVC